MIMKDGFNGQGTELIYSGNIASLQFYIKAARPLNG
jgi:hypothetical protein